MKALKSPLSLPLCVAVSICACSMDPPYVSEAEFAARRAMEDGGGDMPSAGTSGTTDPNGSGSVVPQAGSSSTSAGASSTGGVVESNAGTSSAGTPSGAGMAPTAGSQSTGTGGSGGSGGSGPAGGSGGSTVTEDYSQVAKALDGLRIDDPCSGSPSTSKGATCTHVVNPFHTKKDVTIAGTAGKVYDVVLRIRGVVEPTKVTGGSRSDTTTVTVDSQTFRTFPYTVGGTPGDQTYQPWLLSVSQPAQNYFFNDHGNTAHLTFLLDYQVKIPMAAGAKVTLDVNDANDHEIDNYDKKSNPGIAGSMNLGQYLQINVVSVTPQP